MLAARKSTKNETNFDVSCRNTEKVRFFDNQNGTLVLQALTIVRTYNSCEGKLTVAMTFAVEKEANTFHYIVTGCFLSLKSSMLLRIVKLSQNVEIIFN